MNKELIVDLADKAGFVVEDGKIYADIFDDLNRQIEVLTELIVRECIDIMSDELKNTALLMSNPPQSSAIWDARNGISRHFGIKQ